MPLQSGNLFQSLPGDPGREQFETLLTAAGFRLERIVSHGQATPEGEWYDQAQEEWVVLLSGEAGLQVEGEAAVRRLAPGDWVRLPARCRHRVAWTTPDRPTLWLALHYPHTGD